MSVKQKFNRDTTSEEGPCNRCYRKGMHFEIGQDRAYLKNEVQSFDTKNNRVENTSN